MKRYSKRIREEAALICVIAASMPDEQHRYNGAYINICRLIGIRSSISLEFAASAWCSVYQLNALSQERDAEAEALIRTGWSPP